MTGPDTPKTSTESTKATQSSVRLKLLIGLLLLLAICVPFSWRHWRRSRTTTAASGSLGAQTVSLEAALRASPRDPSIELPLARLRSQAGYYMDSLDLARQARANGAPDKDTCSLIGHDLLILQRYAEADPEITKAAALNGADVDILADEAAVKWYQMHPDAAISALATFVGANAALVDGAVPGSEPTLVRLSTTVKTFGIYNALLRIGHGLMRLDPNSATGYADSGEALLEQKQFDAAAALLQKAIELSPNSSQLWYEYGVALSKLPGRTNDALAQWQHAVTLNSREFRAYFAVAVELLKQKRYVESANIFMLTGGQHFDALEAFTRAADAWRLAGKPLPALFCSAIAANLRGAHAQALAGYQQLADSADPNWRKRGLDGLAATYDATKQYAKFLEAAKKAAFTHTAEDYLQISNAYLRLNQFALRMEWVRKAVTIDPKLAGGMHREMGAYYDRTQNLDAAEREFKNAIAAEPSNPRYYGELVRVYQRREALGNRTALAAEAARKQVELAPNDGGALRRLGAILLAQNDTVHAREALQHAIDVAPGVAGAYLDLAQVLLRIGNKVAGGQMLERYKLLYSQALSKQSLQARLRATPRDIRAWFDIANLYAANGDFATAAESCSAILAIDRSNAPAKAGLALYQRLASVNPLPAISDSAPLGPS